MSLVNITKACGQFKLPGTQLKVKYTLQSDLNGFPATVAAGGGTAAGDTKRLGAAFDFTGAPSGSGYWREADILVDSGDLRWTLEGDPGGQGINNSLPFFIEGALPAQLEAADMFLKYSGCIILSIEGRNGVDYVIGDLKMGVYIRTAEGGLGTTAGEQHGTAYEFYWPKGVTPYTIDATTYPFDTTPNP